nr:PREDICTED: uncharacterized protein LOC105675478 isoform X2 [Linepithema humile]
MPTCVVAGCTSGYRSNPEKKRFFSVPKNESVRQQWLAAVRRKDMQLTQKHYVCENHFYPSSIIWQKILKDADGNVIGVGARTQVPRLERGTVPSVFPWSEFVDTDQLRSAASVQVSVSAATAEVALGTSESKTPIEVSFSKEASEATAEAVKSLEVMDTSESKPVIEESTRMLWTDSTVSTESTAVTALMEKCSADVSRKYCSYAEELAGGRQNFQWSPLHWILYDQLL